VHQSGSHGNWDYCAYDADPKIEAEAVDVKLNNLWRKVAANETIGGKYPVSGAFGVMNQSVLEVVENKRDVMPVGRVKMRHSVGSVCKIEWAVDHASPYSGLFAPGTKEGLVRMSSEEAVDTSQGFRPGLGLKFPRAGRLSGDTVALSSTEKSYWNFFKHNMSNHHHDRQGNVTEQIEELSRHFETSSQCFSQVGLSNMAHWSQDGNEAGNVSFPFKLFFVPTQEAQLPDVPRSWSEIANEIRAFPIGMPLFTVYGCGRPGKSEFLPTDGGIEQACAEAIKLGPIRITSECVPSAFGDEALYIGHQRIEDDWQLRPEWLDQYEVATACGRATKPLADAIPAVCGVSNQRRSTMRTDDILIP
jgi:hypothetical protein